MSYGYEDALIAAGAEVLAFGHFGDYSGQWLAKVRYNGETGWIQDWYGSCTVCDSFQSEFQYPEDGESYDEHLADFGQRYLGSILPASHFLDNVTTSSMEGAEIREWIREVEGMGQEHDL